HEALSLPNIGGGGRGGKSDVRREEHYRLLWEELETFLKAHANNSSMHTELLNCLLEVRNKDDKDKIELDQALRKFDSIPKEEIVARASVIRATTDSPIRSLPKERRPEFHGRLNSDGPRAKLYPNLKEVGREPREPMLEA
ncbi:hypothetical protein PV325_008809, partial [Microctonus aethiopoides]